MFINSLVDSESGVELQFMKPADPEDLIRQEHALFMKQEVEGAPNVASGKINRICDALKVELLQRNENNYYLLPILTVYVKKQPQELKQVLDLIRDMQNEEKNLN